MLGDQQEGVPVGRDPFWLDEQFADDELESNVSMPVAPKTARIKPRGLTGPRRPAKQRKDPRPDKATAPKGSPFKSIGLALVLVVLILLCVSLLSGFLSVLIVLVLLCCIAMIVWPLVSGKMRRPQLPKLRKSKERPAAAGQVSAETAAVKEVDVPAQEVPEAQAPSAPKEQPPTEPVVSAQRFVPTGSVPQHGVRAVMWKLVGARLYARFGWASLATPSWKERDGSADMTIRTLRKVQRIFAFVNTKGGSAKSALCGWMIVLYYSALHRHLVALDANEGPGSTADRLGFDLEKNPNATIQIRRYLDLVRARKLVTYEQFTEEVDWPDGFDVSIIASDPVSSVEIKKVDFQKGVLNAKGLAHGVFCDLGNDIMSPTCIGSVEVADTLIFPGNVHMANSLKDLGNTMQRYSRETGPDKVTNGLIVVVGDRLWWQLLRYRRTQTKLREHYARRFKHAPERVFVVPNNRYMAKGNVVNPDKVPRKIRVILKEIVIAALQTELVPVETVTAETLAKAEDRGQLELQPAHR